MFTFGRQRRKPSRSKKTVKFADSRRQLIIVTTVQCGACAMVKREIPKLKSECSRRKISFLHISGNMGPEIIKKLEFQHPAMTAVCKATPTVMSITNITKDSFNYVMANIQPVQMTTKNILEWWSKTTDKMHSMKATYVPHPPSKTKQEVKKEQKAEHQTIIMIDSTNIDVDPINTSLDYINT